MTTEYTETQLENTRQDLVKGLELTIINHQAVLLEQMDGMTQKQLRKALRTIIEYPEVPSGDDLTDREKRFNGTLLLLNQARIQYEINILADLQREMDAKNNQGEK